MKIEGINFQEINRISVSPNFSNEYEESWSVLYQFYKGKRLLLLVEVPVIHINVDSLYASYEVFSEKTSPKLGEVIIDKGQIYITEFMDFFETFEKEFKSLHIAGKEYIRK